MTRRGVLLGMVLILGATEAWATMGGGSSRIPMTDFLIELYNVTNGIYIPLLSLGALAFGAANLLFGFMRFGPVIGRIFGVIGILGLGVTWFAQSVGASAALNLVFRGWHMEDLFPDTIDVPRGLVTTRLIWGLPVWVFALLLLLGMAPLYLWGFSKWWVVPLALALGWGVATLAHDDPAFLSAWMGELRLKDYYE